MPSLRQSSHIGARASVPILSLLIDRPAFFRILPCYSEKSGADLETYRSAAGDGPHVLTAALPR